MAARLLLISFFIFSCSACVTKEQTTNTSHANFKQSTTSCQLNFDKGWSFAKPPKLVFISIDSLNFDGLKEYVPLMHNPHPLGLKRILEHKNVNNALIVQNPTITASSHSSTITCSKPERHGIFANTQWNGSKSVVGFNEPTGTETFATTLKNSGYKVVAAGYPSLDNSEPGKTVSAGFAYGSVIGKSEIYDLSTHHAPLHIFKDRNNEEIGKIKLNFNTEKRLSVTCASEKCSVQPSKSGQYFDVKIKTDSLTATAYVAIIQPEKGGVYVSALGVNNAFPAEVREQLDSCGIIFSPGKDVSLDRYGPQSIIIGLEHRLSFFNDAWTRFLPQTQPDVLFLYLEDIDSLRHQFADDESAKPFVVQHIEKVDLVLGRFLQSLPEQTNVVIMGDHGMSAVKFELNVRKIIHSEILEKTQIYTSGGTLMIYAKAKADAEVKTLPLNAPGLNDLKISLQKFRLPGQSQAVFEKVYLKGSPEMKEAGLDHPKAPLLIAFAHQDFALQNSLSNDLVLADLSNKALPPPRPRGQHGHFNQNPRMKAFLGLWGPSLAKLDAKQIPQNTDVVPAVAKALNLPVPSHCELSTSP